MDDPSAPCTWQITPQMLEVVPKVLLQIAADREAPPAARVKAASALVEMNEQNARLSRQTPEPVPGSPSPGTTPAVRIELSADGLEALRGNFLGRLAAAGQPAGPAGPAIADRVVDAPAATVRPRSRRGADPR